MDNQNPNLQPNEAPMSYLVWNVQGTGKREFQVTLKEILRINKPSMVVLLETHQDRNCARRLDRLLITMVLLLKRQMATVEAFGYFGRTMKLEFLSLDQISSILRWRSNAKRRIHGSPEQFMLALTQPRGHYYGMISPL